MSIAKVFQSGNSQAVRLPKEFRFESSEVEIFRRGNEVVLLEKRPSPVEAFELLAGLPDDCFAERREDAPPQAREEW